MCIRLERATGLTLYDDVMRGLGFCVERRRWQPGVFAEGTEQQSRDVVMEARQLYNRLAIAYFGSNLFTKCH